MTDQWLTAQAPALENLAHALLKRRAEPAILAVGKNHEATAAEDEDVQMQVQARGDYGTNGEAMKTVYDDLTELLGEHVSEAVVRGLVRYALKRSPIDQNELERYGYPRAFVHQMRYAIEVFVTDPGLRDQCRERLDVLPTLPPLSLRSERAR